MDRRLTYDLVGNDKISPTFAKVAIAAEEANRRMADSNGRLSVAEKKLTDLRTQGKASVTQLAAAEENVARLRRASESASIKLADAQSKLSTTTVSAGQNLEKMGTEAASGASQIGLLGPAAVGAVALIGPAAGAGVAAMVGLGAAAGTALLAYKGLQNEMKDGTTLGKQVQSQFKGITGELTTMETIAARSAGPGVVSALSQVKQFLPTLNPLVATLGSELGKALSTTTGGLITGLKTMQPLMSDAGGYAIRLAQAFANFAGSQQFRSFVEYSRQELPQVGQAVADLAVGLVRLGVDFHPVGDQLVKDIDGIAVALNAVETVGEKAKGIFNNLQVGPKGGLFGNIFVNTSFAHVLASFASGGKTAATSQKDLISSLLSTASATDQLSDAQKRAAAAAGVSDTTFQDVTKTMQSQAQATADATFQMKLQNDAAGLLKSALDTLSGKSLSNAQAQSAFDQAIVSVEKHTDKAGATLVGMSEAAVKNRSDVLNLVTSAETLAGTYGNLKNGSEAARQKLITLRQEIIDNAVANGENRAEVTRYIDSVLRIPPKATTKGVFETTDAEDKIAALKSDLAKLSRDPTVVHAQIDGGSVYGVRKMMQDVFGQPIYQQIIATPGGGFIAQPGSAHPHASGGSLDRGWNLVGEQGPELVYNGGAGGQVKTASQTRRALGGGGMVNNYYISVPAAIPGSEHQIATNLVGILERRVGRQIKELH